MIKSVFIPYSVKMRPEVAALARSTGEMARWQSELRQQTEQAEADLGALLDDGYQVIAHEWMDSDSGCGMTVLVYRPTEREP